MKSIALWIKNQSWLPAIDPLLSRRQPEIMLQVCDEPGHYGQRDARARAKHELTFHCIKRKRIYDSSSTVTRRADLAGKLGAFSECFTQNRLGKSGSETKRFGRGGDDLAFQFLGSFQCCLVDAFCIFCITLFLMLFEWHGSLTFPKMVLCFLFS